LVAFGIEERMKLRMKDDFLNRMPDPTVIAVEGAVHYIQEEGTPEIAAIINDFSAVKPLK
jgi:hypothetical protein